MENCIAVLLDTVSIQQYIFQSNKLRENIGASYLVDEIFRSLLVSALNQSGSGLPKDSLEHWRFAENLAPLCGDGEPWVEIGYIGGGNALLFFSRAEQAEAFVRQWTTLLLLHAPGLQTAVALEKNFPRFIDSIRFRRAMEQLFQQLRKNKGLFHPITQIPGHGITGECSRSERSAEIFNNIVKNFVSAGTEARIRAAKESNERLTSDYLEVKDNTYCFPLELEDLGGVHGVDSHIAIVHIDGNGVGRLIQEAADLKELRKCSVVVDSAVKNAFAHLVDTITEPKQFSQLMKDLGIPPAKGDVASTLPIRPVILGGDDMTFVCDGKLGLYFAREIVAQLEKTTVKGKKLSACAGVAIIKTKYPFYRGYQLAEELCANAKKAARDNNEDTPGSYLDFHVSLGSISGSLQQVRETGCTNMEMTNNPGNLLIRPYVLSGEDDPERLRFSEMVRATAALANWPETKLNDLREALYRPEAERKSFVARLKYRKLELPEISGGKYGIHLFDNSRTPYFDLLEIKRFYPESVLRREGLNNDTH